MAAPDLVFATGDFNKDGKLDLVAGDAVFAGNGDGTFRFPVFYGAVGLDGRTESAIAMARQDVDKGSSVVPISSDLCRIWQDFQRAGAAESSGIT
jgi:hypothetical protein